MSNYVIYYCTRKDMFRKLAKEWKAWADESTLTESQVRGMTLFFRQVGKRFGLITEFKNIGVI